MGQIENHVVERLAPRVGQQLLGQRRPVAGCAPNIIQRALDAGITFLLENNAK